MAKISDLVTELALPIAEEAGCTIWDVEYIKEAGEWYLRVYIDKVEGVGIGDCEAVARPLSDVLDQSDPIEGSYTLEISSAGADRVLKKAEHFEQFVGKLIEVKLYRARDGAKELTGELVAYNDGDVTMTLPEGDVTLEKKDMAQVRLHVTF